MDYQFFLFLRGMKTRLHIDSFSLLSHTPQSSDFFSNLSRYPDETPREFFSSWVLTSKIFGFAHNDYYQTQDEVPFELNWRCRETYPWDLIVIFSMRASLEKQFIVSPYIWITDLLHVFNQVLRLWHLPLTSNGQAIIVGMPKMMALFVKRR